MLHKSVVFVLGVLGLWLIVAFGSHPARPTTPVVGVAVHSDTLIGTVETESLKVISYLDSAGVEHPADATLTPPVPIRGVSELRIVLRRQVPAEPLAAGVRRP